MFQGPKGYIAQIYVKYTCSMEKLQQNGRFTLFLVNSTLIYILFSMGSVLQTGVGRKIVDSTKLCKF